MLSVAQGMDAVFIDNALTCASGRGPAAPRSNRPGRSRPDRGLFGPRAGISHAVEADIRRRQWVKFVLNVDRQPNVHGLYGGSTTALSSRRAKPLLIAAMRESDHCGTAEGD